VSDWHHPSLEAGELPAEKNINCIEKNGFIWGYGV
jgi:inner membrane protein involved in colicin E2 resistance